MVARRGRSPGRPGRSARNAEADPPRGRDVSRPDSAALREAVDKLLYFAKGVGYGLFGERLGDLYEQAELRAPGAFDPSVAARIVEVTAPPDFSYPFELLTWRDPEDLPQEQRQDPALRARALLGMAAIVRRRFDSKQEDGEEQGEGEGEGRARIENEETLRVTVFRNPSLTGAKGGRLLHRHRGTREGLRAVAAGGRARPVRGRPAPDELLHRPRRKAPPAGRRAPPGLPLQHHGGGCRTSTTSTSAGSMARSRWVT